MSNLSEAAIIAARDKLEAFVHLMRVLGMAVEAIEDAGQRHALAAFAMQAERAVAAVQADLAALGRAT